MANVIKKKTISMISRMILLMMMSLSLLMLMLMLHAKQFLLFDYRLNVINKILIYVLITTRFDVDVDVEANVFDKSSKVYRTITTKMIQDISSTIKALAASKTAINNHKTKTKTLTTSTSVMASSMLASILLFNRTSSAIFMADVFDDGTTSPISIPSTSSALAPVPIPIPVTPSYFRIGSTKINAFDNSNFGIGTINETNQNGKGFRIRTKRNIHDDLLALTIEKNATEIETTIANHIVVVNSSRILSRSKRFLTFPEGSSFSCSICMTIGTIGNPRFDNMAYGLNWGVAYDLPNTSWVINHLHGFSRHPVPAAYLRRRTRRSLYREIEMVVDNMGFKGRDCVLRALCESRQYFSKNKLSMIGEMMRVIFSLPKQRIFTRELHENSDIELYDHAFRHSRDISCNQKYDCSFSLLELAFGKYSQPPPGYYN